VEAVAMLRDALLRAIFLLVFTRDGVGVPAPVFFHLAAPTGCFREAKASSHDSFIEKFEEYQILTSIEQLKHRVLQTRRYPFKVNSTPSSL
jgi:hypothetical protein